MLLFNEKKLVLLCVVFFFILQFELLVSEYTGILYTCQGNA